MDMKSTEVGHVAQLKSLILLMSINKAVLLVQ